MRHNKLLRILDTDNCMHHWKLHFNLTKRYRSQNETVSSSEFCNTFVPISVKPLGISQKMQSKLDYCSLIHHTLGVVPHKGQRFWTISKPRYPCAVYGPISSKLLSGHFLVWENFVFLSSMKINCYSLHEIIFDKQYLTLLTIPFDL